MGKEQIHELNTDIRQYLLTKLVCVFVPQLITWAWPTQMISPTSWIYQMLNRWTLHYSEIVSEDKALDDLSLMHSFPLCVLSDQIIPQVISCNVLSVPQVRWFYEYCVYECISCLGVCVLVVSAQFHNFFFLYCLYSDDKTGSSRHGWKVLGQTVDMRTCADEWGNDFMDFVSVISSPDGRAWSSISPLEWASVHSPCWPFILPPRYIVIIYAHVTVL